MFLFFPVLFIYFCFQSRNTSIFLQWVILLRGGSPSKMNVVFHWKCITWRTFALATTSYPLSYIWLPLSSPRLFRPSLGPWCRRGLHAPCMLSPLNSITRRTHMSLATMLLFRHNLFLSLFFLFALRKRNWTELMQLLWDTPWRKSWVLSVLHRHLEDTWESMQKKVNSLGHVFLFSFFLSLCPRALL